MSSGDERVDAVDRMIDGLSKPTAEPVPTVVYATARGMPNGGVHLEVAEYSHPGRPRVVTLELKTQADVARHIRTILEVSLRGLELGAATCEHDWEDCRKCHRCGVER